jgi:NitT/TauT family transport system substrate-binding protein
MVVTKAFLDKNPDVVARFVKASLQGWVDYLKDPEAGNRLIKEANPKMGDEQIAYAVKWMNENKAVMDGDAAHHGVGIMTEARWKATYDYMVGAGLLKPGVDWKAAYTDRFVKDLKVGM